MFTRDKNVFIKHAFENTNLTEISGENQNFFFNVLIQTLPSQTINEKNDVSTR